MFLNDLAPISVTTLLVVLCLAFAALLVVIFFLSSSIVANGSPLFVSCYRRKSGK
jgi:hypothetical protein